MEAICRSIPLEERSRVVAFVFGGLSVGSVMGHKRPRYHDPIMETLSWGHYTCLSWLPTYFRHYLTSSHQDLIHI
ncbi:hypothetical protein HN51_024879 [Arachis hypogaea]